MNPREGCVPQSLETRIRDILRSSFQIDVDEPREQKKLAQDIRQMSDFYADHSFARTPWKEPWCQRAQLAYYLPLNATRMFQVLREGHRLGFFQPQWSYLDFGAGLGAFQAAFAEFFPSLHSPVTEVEVATEIAALRSALGRVGSESRALREIPSPHRDEAPADVLVCSYSLTELETQAAFLFRFPHLILVEPSTREDSRRLLEKRAELIAQGYYIWAPCTHQGPCPLLSHSETDWCHDRIHFNMPEWMKGIESHLPFRNRTLTYSYLLASRNPAPNLGEWARLTGDSRPEKGKTRQMFCRGSEREFLTWMSRHGEAPESFRGELVRIPEGLHKGNELRIQGALTTFPRP